MKNSKKSCSPRPGLKIFFRLGEDDRSHCLLLDCTTVTINLIQAEVFFEMKLANSSELEWTWNFCCINNIWIESRNLSHDVSNPIFFIGLSLESWSTSNTLDWRILKNLFYPPHPPPIPARRCMYHLPPLLPYRLVISFSYYQFMFVNVMEFSYQFLQFAFIISHLHL